MTAAGVAVSQPLQQPDDTAETKSARDIEFETAINELKTRRNSGDLAASTYLGQNYLRWKRSPENTEAALFYLEEAVGYGFAEAQVTLGHIYLSGQLVDKNLDKARHLFIAAAQQGSAEALGVLSWMYMYGSGVEKDPDIARTYMKRAAELGHSLSMDRYARNLIWGRKETANKDLGVFYLRELAENKSDNAAFLLALLHFTGEHLPYDPQTAEQWLVRAAEYGSEEAKVLELQLRYQAAASESDRLSIRSEQNNLVNSLKNNQKNEVAWIMSTHSYRPLHDGRFAIQMMLQVVNDGDNVSPAYLDTLAAAYATAGEFDKAVDTQNRVIAQIEAADDMNLDDGFLERLALYKNKKQYTQ